MSVVQVIRAADCADVPWKNGGGTTREIAVFPPGAGMEDFLWRLSIARVERAGAFSAFDGVDRVLAVLDGRLRLSGPALDARLDAQSAPLAFDGGAALAGEPIHGPVRDLNAMARRGQYAVSMSRLEAGDLAPCAGTGFIVALEPQALGELWLDRLDVARIDAPAAAQGRALHVDFIRKIAVD
ncbi:MAG: HutD family protein [Sphingomonas bacterium]